VKVDVEFDDGDYYIVTEDEMRTRSQLSNSPWLMDSFYKHCVEITDAEWAEAMSLHRQKVDATRAFNRFVTTMGKPTT